MESDAARTVVQPHLTLLDARPESEPGPRSWPEDLRPRRRLAEAGPIALSDAELLAVVLGLGRTVGRTGSPHAEANGGRELQVATDLICEAGGLRALRLSAVQDLLALPGVGEARASAIVAAIELGSRVVGAPRPEQPVISSPADVYDLMRGRLAHLDREHFVVLLLDTKNHLIASPAVSVGTLSSSIVHPREVFKPAVKAGAANIILTHNHPSGSVRSSTEDRTVTNRLVEAGEIFGITVLDHVIIGDGYLSMKESGDI